MKKIKNRTTLTAVCTLRTATKKIDVLRIAKASYLNLRAECNRPVGYRNFFLNRNVAIRRAVAKWAISCGFERRMQWNNFETGSCYESSSDSGYDSGSFSESSTRVGSLSGSKAGSALSSGSESGFHSSDTNL
jgi:hypothetical protein